MYAMFGGRVLMCFMGKSATASSKVMYDGPWTRFRTSARTMSFFTPCVFFFMAPPRSDTTRGNRGGKPLYLVPPLRQDRPA